MPLTRKTKLLLIYVPFFLVGAVLALWAFVIEPSRLLMNSSELKVNRWDKAHNGLRIVAISDIHGGSNFVTEARIREVVEKANAQNPDLIFLLGDYVSQQHLDRKKLKMPISTIADNLAGLKAKYGVYAVIGNHDNWYDETKVEDELSRIGYKVLENEAVSLNINGTPLRILGMADALTIDNLNTRPYSDAGKDALAALTEREGKVIIITHNPDSVDYLTEGFAVSPDTVLMLAGHTHGGQCRFPFIGAPIVPSTYGQKHAAGFVRDRGIDMFITTGVGMSILPVRFGVPPEIAVLDVYAAEE
jgi:uncharacterized protein